MEGHTISPLAPVLNTVGLPVSMHKTLFQAESVMLSFRMGYGLYVIHDLAELFRLAHSAEE